MSEILSFPGLGLEFSLTPVIIQITDTWAIKWYGVIVTLAFVLGCGYALRRCRTFGLDQDRVLDVLIGSVIGGVVGARLYYVFFSDWATYRADPLSILKTWEGGIAIYGGIIGGVLVGLAVCRWRRVKMLPMLDCASVGLLLGQALGRWGNFVNMEAFGTNTDLPWGMTSPTISWYLQSQQQKLAELGVMVDPAMPVHPTFLYESLWCLIGALLLIWYTKRRKFDGELILMYAGWYGLGRFGIEGLRTDSLMWGSVRVSQALALVCVLVSVAVLLVIRSKLRRSTNPDYLRLYVDTDEGKAILAGTFYQNADSASASENGSDVTAARRRFGQRPVRLRGRKQMARIRMRARGTRVPRGIDR